MKIFNKIKRNFTVIPNEINKHGLSLQAIGLFLYIASKPDNWNFSYAGTASQTNNGRDSIKSAVSELEKVGFLVRIRETNKIGQFKESHWVIYDKPKKDAESQSTETLPQETPLVGSDQEVNNKESKKEKVKVNFSSLREVDTSPNPLVSSKGKEASNPTSEMNPDLLRHLQKKQARKDNKGSWRNGGYKKPKDINSQLNIHTGLKMSLNDNLTEDDVKIFSKKYDLTREDVLKEKDNYLEWIRKNSGSPRVWGKNMMMYVDDFCRKTSVRIKAKEEVKAKKTSNKPKSMFDEMNEKYKAFPEHLEGNNE